MQVAPLRIVFSADDRAEIWRRIDRALATGQLAQGENVREFEERFARYTGAKHAVAVSSGGAALEVAMRLLGVAGREVLVPTNTFAATANAVTLAGGRVRLVDADPTTFGVSLESLQATVTPATAGVIVVHIGGIITPDIVAIREWCDRRGLWLFEDAAHAHGSELNGKQPGHFGIAAAYSFFSTKVITSGEGGMLVTNDDELANRARVFRDYGKPSPWITLNTDLATNWRMSEFCAAVGVVHLARLDEFISWRERLAQTYLERMTELPEMTVVRPAERSSEYKFIVLLPDGVDRDRVRQDLKARGIGLPGGVYDIPLHRQPIYAGADGDFPAADDICARHICLPTYYGLSEGEAHYVVDALKLALVTEAGAVA